MHTLLVVSARRTLRLREPLLKNPESTRQNLTLMQTDTRFVDSSIFRSEANAHADCSPRPRRARRPPRADGEDPSDRAGVTSTFSWLFCGVYFFLGFGACGFGWDGGRGFTKEAHAKASEAEGAHTYKRADDSARQSRPAATVENGIPKKGVPLFETRR
jgi:hypothetical protein